MSSVFFFSDVILIIDAISRHRRQLFTKSYNFNKLTYYKITVLATDFNTILCTDMTNTLIESTYETTFISLLKVIPFTIIIDILAYLRI